MKKNISRYIILLLSIIATLVIVEGSLHAKIKYVHGPDVPKGETLLCRYPKDFDAIKDEIDLTTQQRGDLRCELKHFLESQRPCDFRKVKRYRLVTITMKGAHVSFSFTFIF